MTDEQIEKALECCADTEFSSCHECPVCPSDGTGCIERLCSYALALIRRQKAQLVEQMLTVDAECDKCIAEARAEAIREFAERLDGYLTVNCTIAKNAVKSSIADDDIYFHGGKEIAFADVKQRIISILQEMTEEQK